MMPIAGTPSLYHVTELASLFKLSRSTLLYYDRIGLLNPSVRSRANYRRYSEADRTRLQAICAYREKGLTLKEIRILLEAPDDTTAVLQQRFLALEEEIRQRQNQQRLLAEMLHVTTQGWKGRPVDKAMWVEMLEAAGMNDEAMDAWHREFERRSPEGHRLFLESLGIGPDERERIRKQARSIDQRLSE